jgi:hypothetical protein
MKLENIPGYNDLFGKPNITYEQLLSDMPSDLVLNLLISLNNELYTNETESERQSRLRQIIASRFTSLQHNFLNNAYQKYIEKNNFYTDMIFGRRYLLAMVIKEISINRKGIKTNDTPQHEYNFLMAYLITVQEINDTDSKFWNEFKTVDNDPDALYRVLWQTNINQFEFNERDNGPFGIAKVLAFCKYALANLRPYLRQYLVANNFKSISQFIASFSQILKGNATQNTGSLFRRLNHIRPLPGVDETHLKSQCINNLLGSQTTIKDLRKFPLYQLANGSYKVIDETFYNNKLYRGPFFELYYETDLKSHKKFNQYSSEISKDVLENICFKGVCEALVPSLYDCLHFDDNSQAQPDCYYRQKKTIIFIEFKDYMFPDELISNPSFKELKSYMDERLIFSKKGKPKGINQLIQNLVLLNSKRYGFDRSLIFSDKSKIDVFPIICYSDFMFNMPGVNKYMGDVFKERKSGLNLHLLNVLPVTMINIETMFDLYCRKGDFSTLKDLIERYHQIIQNRELELRKHYSVNNFLDTTASFDEIYNSLFLPEFLAHAKGKTLSKLSSIIGITQQELDEIL